MPGLVGCDSVIDAEQARLCRSIAAALHSHTAEIRETTLTPISGSAAALKFSYRVREPERGFLPRWIICTFAGESGYARFDLTAVDTGTGPLSDVKLFILKRWWLDAGQDRTAEGR